MPLSDAEKRAVALLRREGAAWRQARWILLAISLGALLFGLIPWTRLVFDLTALASAPNEVVPYLVLGIAQTWSAQGIAAVVGAFGLFVVLRTGVVSRSGLFYWAWLNANSGSKRRANRIRRVPTIKNPDMGDRLTHRCNLNG